MSDSMTESGPGGVSEEPRVRFVLETCLYAHDLEVVEHFYQAVLGLEPFSREKGRHVFFRCGEGMLLVFNPEVTSRPSGQVPPHGARGPGHVAFRMEREEISAWRGRLEMQQVEVEVEVRWPGGGVSLYFRDPAGNSLELATASTWNR